jgi:hypothetical protein
MVTLTSPIARPTAFDDPASILELKFDGFRAAADTVRGRLIPRNGNWMPRFAGVLDCNFLFRAVGGMCRRF